jgi:hypothetical protein
VAVSLAGWGAFVQSVSATELTVIPGPAIPSGCSDITGEISVTNITTGSTGSGGSFTYVVPDPVITGVSPGAGGGGTSVTITGVNLPSTLADAEVKFGGQSALVTSASSTSLTVVAPTSSAAAPACTGANPAGTLQTVATVDVSVTDRSTTCSFTASGAFQMQLPCVVPTPTPGP